MSGDIAPSVIFLFKATLLPGGRSSERSARLPEPPRRIVGAVPLQKTEAIPFSTPFSGGFPSVDHSSSFFRGQQAVPSKRSPPLFILTLEAVCFFFFLTATPLTEAQALSPLLFSGGRSSVRGQIGPPRRSPLLRGSKVSLPPKKGFPPRSEANTLLLLDVCLFASEETPFFPLPRNGEHSPPSDTSRSPCSGSPSFPYAFLPFPNPRLPRHAPAFHRPSFSDRRPQILQPPPTRGDTPSFSGDLSRSLMLSSPPIRRLRSPNTPSFSLKKRKFLDVLERAFSSRAIASPLCFLKGQSSPFFPPER